MLDKSTVNVSLTYGLLGGVVSFIYGLAIYFLYGQNPYSEQTEFSGTLIFVPAFVFLGVKYFKNYIDTELSFKKAFTVAILIVLILACSLALLQLIFTLAFGGELVSQFANEARGELFQSKTELVKSIGKENYEMMVEEVGNRSALSLSLKQVTLRFLVGFFISIVSAVFFRK
ncbi:DUF4199 domain-containing protein [Nibribacter koreensis]|uniref:DUF4199 domain-containing protein n=1 Tax=Nibribacter koreensis TaxID=1084519 RepID=A0ABP8G3Q0_9BACT